jgi:hypothetical protein
MKTYAEKNKRKPFNWFKALTDKKANFKRLSQKSVSWTTCACGNQCDIIPRTEMGAPKDDQLANLGVSFHEAVLDRDRKKAISILHQIEKRSSILIIKAVREEKKDLKAKLKYLDSLV